jgi:hypothetical protein
MVVHRLAAFGKIADDYYIPGRRDVGYSVPVVHLIDRTPADNTYSPGKYNIPVHPFLYYSEYMASG